MVFDKAFQVLSIHCYNLDKKYLLKHMVEVVRWNVILNLLRTLSPPKKGACLFFLKSVVVSKKGT